MTDRKIATVGQIAEKPESLAPATRTDAAAFATLREAAMLPVDRYPDERLRSVLKMCVPANATLAQAATFLEACERYDLDPRMGQVWLAITDEGPKIVTGRETYITLMARQPTFAGYQIGLVMAGEAAEIWTDPSDPYTVHVDHRQRFDGGTDIVGGYIILRDTERPPLILRRWWEDYRYLWSNPKKKGWARDPKGMFETRMIAAAGRRMYSLSGLLIVGEDEDLDGGTAVMESAIGTHAQTQAEDLRNRLAAVTVRQPWHPDLTIPSGVHEGETWREVIHPEDPDDEDRNRKWARRAAAFRWLGLTREDAVALSEYLDATEPAPADASGAQDADDPGGDPPMDPAPSSDVEGVSHTPGRDQDVDAVACPRCFRTWPVPSEQADAIDADGHCIACAVDLDPLTGQPTTTPGAPNGE